MSRSDVLCIVAIVFVTRAYVDIKVYLKGRKKKR